MTRAERLAEMRKKHRQLISDRLDTELAREKRETRRLTNHDLYPVSLRSEMFKALLGKLNGYQTDEPPTEADANIELWQLVYDVLNAARYRGKLFVARSVLPPHKVQRSGKGASVYLYTSPNAVVPKGYVLVPREIRKERMVADYIGRLLGASPVKVEKTEPTHPVVEPEPTVGLVSPSSPELAEVAAEYAKLVSVVAGVLAEAMGNMQAIMERLGVDDERAA